MKTVALISGGKDSCFCMMQCVAAGHDIVALANLYPVGEDELDSFMFQTVGHQGVKIIGEAMGLPLYREPTLGKSKMQEKNYTPTDDDEVEDLYRLLKKVKECEKIEAVSSGAIASDYQRMRVENVCSRLGLISLSYLWQRNQEELLNEMIQCSVNAIIIKVAALGLKSQHLGKSLVEMQSHLKKMNEKYGLNVCGEGGEYETFTLDCPLYIKRIVIEEYESIVHSKDDIAPVGYLNFKNLQLSDKNKMLETLSLRERLKVVPIKAPHDYMAEILCPKEEDGCNSSQIGTEDPDVDNTDFKTNIPRDYFGSSTTLEASSDAEKCPDNITAIENGSGWLWFGGISSDHSNPKLAMQETLDKLHDLMETKRIEFSDIVSVTLYIKNMDNYSLINEVYITKFAKVNPPVRVCVECPLNVHVVLEALAHREKNGTEDEQIHKKHTLHVQSISHWAPANVGPYSQAVRVGDVILVAGQIPLVPGSMTILDSNVKQQCQLTLRHIDRLLKAMDDNAQLRDIVQAICFVTSSSYIPNAREEWEKRKSNAMVDYMVVSNLPRGASVEWCVWAHKNNSRFEYEETSRCFGNFKISLRRRWNHDNNVSAIVAYISGGSSIFSVNLLMGGDECSADLITEELTQCFQFLIRSLKEGSRIENPACNLRVFYKAKVSSCCKIIQKVFASFSNQNLVVPIIPTVELHNDDTFLSVCGIRLE